MKKGWEIRVLGDACNTVQDGAHESPKHQFDSPGRGRFLYITSKNIRNNYLDLENVSYVGEDFHNRIYPRCRPSLGDVLLTKDGANTGNVTLNTLDEPFSLLSSVCLIKTKPDALMPAFLCYYIQSPNGLASITGQMTGAAIKRIILRDIKLAALSLPPLPEQRRLVALLDEAFEAITAARAAAERNLQNARDLFQSHLNEVFTKKGDGWVEKAIGDFCKTSSGGTPLSSQKEYYEGGTIPWLLSGEVAQGNVREAKNFITKAGLDNSAAKLFPKDTVLVAMYGATAGQVGILRFEAATNQAVCGILPNATFRPEFLFYFLLAKKDELVAQATGNAQPNISQIKIRNTIVPIPPIAEQKTITTHLDALSAETRRLAAIHERKLAALEALKQSLLHRAFEGEL